MPVSFPLATTVYVPDFPMDTHTARGLLPTEVSIETAVHNISRASLFVAALATGRTDLLRTATEDAIHQPPRSTVFPALPKLIGAAVEAGAHGAFLSGAGSSVLALVDPDHAERVGAAMTEAARHGVRAHHSDGITRTARYRDERTSRQPLSGAERGSRPLLDVAAGEWAEQVAEQPGGSVASQRARRLIVQKYGGTSVGSAERIVRSAERIAAVADAGYDVVVTVSAMGKTTDELIGLARQVSRDPNDRELDQLLVTGEQVSASLMAMALIDRGRQAVSLTGAQAGIRTTACSPRPASRTSTRSGSAASSTAGRIPIVTGFQGITEEQDVTTIGRGGSDTSAVAIAAALGAERCEILTDVEGIYTADPRVVSNARKLDKISYEEMLELASLGARVMHPRAVELGEVYGVPILVRSSFSDAPGTLITRIENVEVRKNVRGIAHDTDVAKIRIVGVPDRPGIAAAIFMPLADAAISVDTIVQNTSLDGKTDLSFTVEPGRSRPGGGAGRDDRAEHRRVRPGPLGGPGEGLGGRDRDAERAGLRRADVPGAGGGRHQHRHDHDLGHPDHLHHLGEPGGRGRERAARDVRPRSRVASYGQRVASSEWKVGRHSQLATHHSQLTT